MPHASLVVASSREADYSDLSFKLPVLSVPACDEAVPAPPGTPLPYQYLPGRRHPHVVPVERAERLHRGHLELRLLSGHMLRSPEPLGPAR